MSRLYESQFQQSCIRWFRMNYPNDKKMLFSIPNGAHLAGNSEIAKAKKWRRLESEGAMPGASDLVLLTNPVTFIEMKFDDNKQTPSQKDFELAVIKYGHHYHLCYEYEDFKRIIIESTGKPPLLDMIAKDKYFKP